MRKLIVTEFVTLDGIMEAPEQWVFEFHTEETAKFKLDEMLQADALVCPLVLGSGRRLFTAAAVPTHLTLAEIKTFDTGALLLRYEAA